MSDWLMKVIRAEADRLIELAKEDPELRADLRSLAESVLEATGRQSATDQGNLEISKAEEPPEDEPRHKLTLGQARTPPPAIDRITATSHRGHDAPGDLVEVASRCRWKAEAARIAADQKAQGVVHREFSGTRSEPEGEGSAWMTKLIDGFHWSTTSVASQLVDVTPLEEVAGCFETVAETLDLVSTAGRRSRGTGHSLELLAEAQSALRAALRQVGILDDEDQLEVYEWLRTEAARHRVYLKRFMRADDLADPSQWKSLLDRVEQAASAGRRDPRAVKLLDQIRGQQEAILRTDGEAPAWSSLIDVVEALVRGGLPPSDRELRELLLPVLDLMPDRGDLPSGMRLALREIDHFLATRPLATQAMTPSPGPDVAQVAGWLSGKSLVLIGGQRRRDAQEALRRAFALESVVWIATRPHESVEHFEPMIARPEVSVVLLAIRWSSHGFAEVRQLCDRHGKPLVRLPGGYGPNQVAAQIVIQCSRQFEATEPKST